VNLRAKFDKKILRETRTLSRTQAVKWAKPEVIWRACTFTTFGVIGHQP